ncbi:MAG: bile acid:sodium symporter [Caldilineaceae bacterium]|nr:bile acid:sodium symporter [Caldilineaceae bacterium]
MQEIVTLLINLFVLTFVLTSMFGTGLSLTVPQILEPLKDWTLVLLALLGNFIIVPALAYGIALVLGLSDGLRAGLIILAACAGAPFLPKLAGVAKGNLAFSVGLMVLLMVVTVVFAPVVLPLLIPGVAVNPWDIARPLITLMLIPLGIGLGVKAWTPSLADSLAPMMNQASSLSLMLAGVLALLIGYRELLGVVGTGAFLATTLLIAGALATGFLLSRGGPANRSVMALGTGQRNISAALLIATTNFTDPEVILIVMVGSVVGLVLLFLAAGFLGKRAAAPA